MGRRGNKGVEGKGKGKALGEERRGLSHAAVTVQWPCSAVGPVLFCKRRS